MDELNNSSFQKYLFLKKKFIHHIYFLKLYLHFSTFYTYNNIIIIVLYISNILNTL